MEFDESEVFKRIARALEVIAVSLDPNFNPDEERRQKELASLKACQEYSPPELFNWTEDDLTDEEVFK
jgi:hypothetical protein